MSDARYRKSESRDVRPFFMAAGMMGALDQAEVRLYGGGEYSSAQSFTLEEADGRPLDIAVRPNLDRGVLKGGPVPRARLVLAVIAQNRFLKRSAVVLEAPATGDLPPEIAVASDIVGRLGGGPGLVIRTALCLDRDASGAPGAPYLRGHWLAAKNFELRRPVPAARFEIEPVTDEGWVKLGYPPKTLYAVDYLGGINASPEESGGSPAKIRLHADVFNSREFNRSDSPMTALLAAEFVAQVVEKSLDDWVGAAAPAPGSVLAGLLKQIASVRPCTLTELRAWVEEPGAARLRAALQVHEKVVRRMVEA